MIIITPAQDDAVGESINAIADEAICSSKHWLHQLCSSLLQPARHVEGADAKRNDEYAFQKIVRYVHPFNWDMFIHSTAAAALKFEPGFGLRCSALSVCSASSAQ